MQGTTDIGEIIIGIIIAVAFIMIGISVATPISWGFVLGGALALFLIIATVIGLASKALG